MQRSFLYIKSLIFFLESGGHLLSHIVSNIVPSAVQVLTIVFGMGTGVTPERIATRNFALQVVSATKSNVDVESLLSYDNIYFGIRDAVATRTPVRAH